MASNMTTNASAARNAPAANPTIPQLVDDALIYSDWVKEALGEEKFSLFTAVLQVYQGGLLTEEELFDRVEHLFSTVPEPDQTFMNEGFGYFMPERPNADMSFQRAQELLQVEEHIQAHPEIEDLVLYAYFVRCRVSDDVYDAFMNLFELYVSDWPLHGIPVEAYREFERVFNYQPDVLEHLRFFMEDFNPEQMWEYV